MISAPLKTYHWKRLTTQERERFLARCTDSVFDTSLRAEIVALIEDVRTRGDAALLAALKHHDGCEIEGSQLKVSEQEFELAYAQVSSELVEAIDLAVELLQVFNRRQLADGSWQEEIRPGLTVGEQAAPISSAGLFVPSGKGSFPSTLLHLATPATVAGVPNIAVVVPPVPGGSGEVDPAVLVAADRLGIRQVFRVNGPAGIAALAFGTETIPQVRKVVGPGSPPVQLAQIEVQRYGCLTEMLMGPSESLIVADQTADPALLAADLLIEAEHGPDSASVLVTTSEELLAAVQLQLTEQLQQLPQRRRDYAELALGTNGGAVVVETLTEAYQVANLYAPEHLQLVVEDLDAGLAEIVHAGEVLLGQGTPSSLANYVLGVPHALPTGRFARANSGITARSFIKYSTLAKVEDQAFVQLASAAITFAEHEGFPAHAAALKRRLRRNS